MDGEVKEEIFLRVLSLIHGFILLASFFCDLRVSSLFFYAVDAWFKDSYKTLSRVEDPGSFICMMNFEWKFEFFQKSPRRLAANEKKK